MKIRVITTRADRWLIVFLALGSILTMLFFLVPKTSEATSIDISVQVDGREIERLSLAKAEGRTLRYETEFGRNVVRVEDGQVFVLEADCPDQICIREGKISKAGELLVCLPNRFIVELVSRDATEPEVDVYLK